MAKKTQHFEKGAVKTFGLRLNYLLKKYKLSKKDFANSIGYHPNIITAWTKGISQPTYTTMYEIVSYFNKNFPDSNPMELLFPDLVKHEMQMLRELYKSEIEAIKEKYQKDLDKCSLDKYTELENKYKRFQKGYNHEFYAIREVLLHLPKEMVDYFEKHLDLAIWVKWGC